MRRKGRGHDGSQELVQLAQRTVGLHSQMRVLRRSPSDDHLPLRLLGSEIMRIDIKYCQTSSLAVAVRYCPPKLKCHPSSFHSTPKSSIFSLRPSALGLRFEDSCPREVRRTSNVAAYPP